MVFGGKRHARGAAVYSAHPFAARHGLLFVVLCLIALSVYGNLTRISTGLLPIDQAAAVSPPQATIDPAPALPAANSTTSSPGSLTADASVSQQNTAKTRQCTGESYSAPIGLPLSAAPEGLTVVVDKPLYYQVYGSSVGELRRAIDGCSLRQATGDFHALTTYSINWSYDTSVISGSTCQLKNIRVGQHINQYLPLFSAEATTEPSVTAAWQTYIANLRNHEDNHAAIDRDYAQRLITALQTIGPMDCATLARQTQTVIDSHVAMLNAANELYDSQTNHGATQGAVL